MTLGGMFTEKYVFGQHLTEPTASNLPCSLIYEQTTKQGQIGPKPEKASGSYLNAREVVYIYVNIYAAGHLTHRFAARFRRWPGAWCRPAQMI